MDLRKYLKDLGYDTVSSNFYTKIKEWESWYQSNVRRFHRYKVHNGKHAINCQRYALGMAKKVSEDMADLLLNEMVEVTTSDEAVTEYVRKILKDNRFSVTGNDYQERKCYTGTVAYIPYLDNTLITEDGVVQDGTIKINYVSAGNIYPLSWENGYISECAFLFPKTVSGKPYAHVQIHKLGNADGVSQYIIENRVVECTAGAGRELSEAERKGLKGFENLVPEVYTGSDRRQFVIDRLNITNNIDEDNPMGIALFANVTDQLKGCDISYDSYVNEFILGRKRIFVCPEMMEFTETGDPTFDPNDVIFYQLPEDYLKSKDGKPIIEVNMELRAEEHSKALNDNIKMVSFKSGFGTERYQFEKGSITTATEVISANSDMFRTLRKHELILEGVLIELAQIIIRLGNVLHQNLAEDVEITVNFDDSIIEDTDKDRENDRKDVALGAFGLDEYRAKWRGETIEEAGKLIVTEEGEPDPEEE